MTPPRMLRCCCELKELTYLGHCECKKPYVCFECYDELDTRYLVNMSSTLTCPFCRADFSNNNMFRELHDTNPVAIYSTPSEDNKERNIPLTTILVTNVLREHSFSS